MRKAGTEERRVYFSGMDDSEKDVDYESDSDFSESSAASSAASAEEQKLREEQQAAETVRSPTFFFRCDFRTYVRTLDVAGAPGSEDPARRFGRDDGRSLLHHVPSR